MKIDFRSIGKSLWEILVVSANMLFYLMCLIGIMIAILCAMWILVEAGHDITQISERLDVIAYLGLTCIAVIMIDKLRELFQKGKKE